MLLAIQKHTFGYFCKCVVADGNVDDILHKATNMNSTYSSAVQIPWTMPLPHNVFSTLDSSTGFAHKTLSLS